MSMAVSSHRIIQILLNAHGFLWCYIHCQVFILNRNWSERKCQDHTETDKSCYQMYKKNVLYIQHLYVRNNHKQEKSNSCVYFVQIFFRLRNNQIETSSSSNKLWKLLLFSYLLCFQSRQSSILIASFYTSKCNLYPLIYKCKLRDSYPVDLINNTMNFLPMS